jgi:dipeptidyl aminopeptidase/acylaminoacyl peptidase
VITGEDRLSEPSWSPDGARLAFVRDHGASAGNHEIWTARADGRDAVRLTTSAAEDLHPAWSPGGGRIAFASNRDGNYEIYVMNADGSAQTRLTNAAREDRGPDWSPDGAQISFVSDNGLFRMRADGNEPVGLAENAESERGGGTAWSPDGTSIAFVFSCHGAPDCPLFGDVSSVRTDGTGLNRVTTLGRTRNPDWQPLDIVAPSIALSSPVQDATYRRGQLIRADYVCLEPTLGGSGVSSCTGDVASGAAIDTSTTGPKALTVRTRDAAGNERTITRTYTVGEAVPGDNTGPSIAITTPAAGATYGAGQEVEANYSCSDDPGGSGVELCAGNAANGAPIDTSLVGTATFTVLARDRAGNPASLTRVYTVADTVAASPPPRQPAPPLLPAPPQGGASPGTPVARLSVRSGSLRRGLVRATIVVPNANTRVRALLLRQRRVVGRASRRLTTAGEARVTVRLSPKYRARFRRLRRVTLTLRVTLTASGHGPVTLQRRVTLRR